MISTMVAKETPGSIAMVLCIWQTTFLHIRHRGMMLARLFLDARFSPETKREEQKDCDSDNENGDDDDSENDNDNDDDDDDDDDLASKELRAELELLPDSEPPPTSFVFPWH